MRLLAAALIALLPNLAQAQDVAYICTTRDNPEEGLYAEIHYPNGQSLSVNAYVDGSQRSEIVRQSAVRSLVPFLWELAEPVLALPPEDVGASENCDARFTETLIVGFSDGTTRRRDEICIDGAINYMGREVIWARPHDLDVRDVKRDELGQAFEDPAEVCGRDW